MGTHVRGNVPLAEFRLHAVFGLLAGVDDTIGGAAMRPDEEQDVFAIRDRVHLVDEAIRALDWAAVDFENDIARCETGIIGWAGRTNALDLNEPMSS